MSDLPPKLNGFLRALCAIANGAYPEGGMSCHHEAGVPEPLPAPSTARSTDAVMASFFDVALGNYNSTHPVIRDHVVQELRRVVREESGCELAEVQMEGDPGGAFSTLSLWWRGDGVLHRVALFWSLD